MADHGTNATRWLSLEEQEVWRAYLVASSMLSARLADELEAALRQVLLGLTNIAAQLEKAAGELRRFLAANAKAAPRARASKKAGAKAAKQPAKQAAKKPAKKAAKKKVAKKKAAKKA